jgi:hypothetical protein
MRVTGPHTNKYKGDKDAAKEWHKFALKLLGQLEARMRKTNQTRGTWRRTTVDGTRIEVTSIASVAKAAPIRIVRVYSPSLSLHEATETYYYYGIESGLLLFTAATSIYGTTIYGNFPLEVYLGEGLDGYVTGGGSSLPGYDENRYLFWGYRESDPPGACLSWPDTFPLSDENSYTSEGFTTSGALASTQGHIVSPTWYTGKARFAAQCKLQAGHSIGEISPWPSSPRAFIDCNLGVNDAVFHDGQYNYWLIRTDSSGCKAVKLAPSDEWEGGECLKEMLTGGLLSADDEIRIEGYYLSLLIPVDGSEIEVLTSAELEDVYEGGKVAWGPHGWKYSPQTEYDDPTEGMITTWREADGSTSGAYYTTVWLYKIVFDVTENNVTATISEEESGDFFPHPGADYLFIPISGTALPYWWNCLSSGYVSKGNDTAFYAFWSRDKNDWEIMRYTYEYHSSSATLNYASLATETCTQMSQLIETYPAGSATTGFTFDQHPDCNITFLTEGTYDSYERVYEWAVEGTVNCNCARDVYVYCNGLCGSNPFWWVAVNNAARCQWFSLSYTDCYYIEHTIGSGTCITYRRYMQNASTRKYFFITDDAEGVYATESVYGVNGIYEEDIKGRYQNLLIKSQYTSVNNGAVLGPYQQVIQREGSNGADNCGPGEDEVYFYGMANWGHTSVSNLTDICIANLVTSHGSITLDETDSSVWRKTITIYEPFYPVSMPLDVSAIEGDTFYKNSPDEYLWTGNYQADEGELTSRNKRFIGYA